MNTLAFFNNEYSIDKTSLVYHIAQMLVELEHRVLVVDIDPQVQLTSMFLKIEKLQEIYEIKQDRPTIIRAVEHLHKTKSSPEAAPIHKLTDKLGLISGDPELALFEDKFSEAWIKRQDDTGRKTTLLFYDIIKEASDRFKADYTIINLGADFSAINRAAFMAVKHLVLPITANVFSLSNIKNIGHRIKHWQSEKQQLLAPYAPKYDNLSEWIGYVFVQHAIRENLYPSPAADWGMQAPYHYQSHIMNIENPSENPTFLLANVRYYYSLHSMSKEFRKPIFLLKPADGAIGSHVDAVRIAYKEYKTLTEDIIEKIKSYTPSHKITI